MDGSSAYFKNFSLSNFKSYKYIKSQIGNYRRGYEQHLVNTKKLKLNFNSNKDLDNNEPL